MRPFLAITAGLLVTALVAAGVTLLILRLESRTNPQQVNLRPGITLAHAADVLWTYSSPELYELLVIRRGWSPKTYGLFVAEAMIKALR